MSSSTAVSFPSPFPPPQWKQATCGLKQGHVTKHLILTREGYFHLLASLQWLLSFGITEKAPFNDIDNVLTLKSGRTVHYSAAGAITVLDSLYTLPFQKMPVMACNRHSATPSPMAKFNIVIAILVLFLMVSTGLADESFEVEISPSALSGDVYGEDPISPSPYSGEEFDDEYDEAAPPTTEEDNYERECALVLGQDCGSQIFYGIFYDQSVNTTCCRKLVYMGKDCSDILVKSVLKYPGLGKFDPRGGYFHQLASPSWLLRSATIEKGHRVIPPLVEISLASDVGTPASISTPAPAEITPIKASFNDIDNVLSLKSAGTVDYSAVGDHEEQAEPNIPQEGRDPHMVSPTNIKPSGVEGASTCKKCKLMEESIASPIQESARRTHTGIMNTVVELIIGLHDASPIHASASKLSWKKMARKTKVSYQPSTRDLVQHLNWRERHGPMGRMVDTKMRMKMGFQFWDPNLGVVGRSNAV
ncbi:hypothetical protein Tsubulata_034663 [Turnera subulata]|uniref:Prolamin-like domain-containing protein n=1 Tax=Turnera subulata TaxID=218843 RepID=A0A9Q0FZY7_9ROSI|nr:hypothetical protein Tsubulata_034663 [Turnera subulata]